MQYSSTISLVVRVIDSDIFEGMGEIGEDGHATDDKPGDSRWIRIWATDHIQSVIFYCLQFTQV